MKKKGSELIFISQINSSGLSFSKVDNKFMQEMDGGKEFYLSYLSITKGTWIAQGAGSTYVAKIKPVEDLPENNQDEQKCIDFAMALFKEEHAYFSDEIYKKMEDDLRVKYREFKKPINNKEK